MKLGSDYWGKTAPANVTLTSSCPTSAFNLITSFYITEYLASLHKLYKNHICCHLDEESDMQQNNSFSQHYTGLNLYTCTTLSFLSIAQ